MLTFQTLENVIFSRTGLNEKKSNGFTRAITNNLHIILKN